MISAAGIPNGKKFKAAQTGGPSGGVLTEEFLDIPIDYESLQSIGSMMGSGGMIVMDEDDCMVDVTRFYLDFSVDESCGKCSPCRIGRTHLLQHSRSVLQGSGKTGRPRNPQGRLHKRCVKHRSAGWVRRLRTRSCRPSTTSKTNILRTSTTRSARLENVKICWPTPSLKTSASAVRPVPASVRSIVSAAQ